MVSPERRRWGGGVGRASHSQSPSSEGALRGLQDGEGGSLLEQFCPPDLCQAVPGPFSFYNRGWGWQWIHRRFLATNLMVTLRVKANTVSLGPWDPTQEPGLCP